MQVHVAERVVEVEEGVSLFSLRDRLKPGADVVIRNGAVAVQDCALSEGDRVVFVRRGEIPSREELEFLLVARHTPGVHERVKSAVVGIAGLGGLGSAVAVALARTGVGCLVLADFDVVEPSNLNRQQYFVDQLGLPKTDALASNLRRVNPYVTVVTHCVRLESGNVPVVFGGVDVLVEAFDSPQAKAMLVESFVQAFPGKPVVMASGVAGYGSMESLGVLKMGVRVYVIGDLQKDARPGRGLMAPRVGIAAHMQADVVLQLLLGETPVARSGG